MKKKILYSIFTLLFVSVICKFSYAATANITANKTSVNVGDSVTITVTINAAAWNVKTSGSITAETIAGANMDAVNQTTTQTYKLDTSKAGTYTAYITGDITDADDTFSNVSSSVTVTVKEKPTNTNTNTGSSSSGSGNNNTTTTVTKSSDATLKALKINIEGMSPTFNKNTYIYTLSVGSEVNSIKVTASTNNSKAKYSVSGNTNLKDGDNTVLVTVKAENGATRTYKIIVTKAENPEKANAYLTNIVVDNAKLIEEFTRENLEYTLEDVNYDIGKLELSVFPENTKATFEIQGADKLEVGENVITILVTAEDGKTTKEYTLKVTRKEEPKGETLPDDIVEQNNLTENKTNGIWDNISENAERQLLILIYILAVVEFIEILYLFVQLRKKDESDKEYDTLFSDKNKRRKKSKINED